MTGLAVLSAPGRWITSPPAGFAGVEDLRRLLTVRNALGLDDSEQSPDLAAARRIAGRLDKDGVVDTLVAASDGVDRAIAASIAGVSAEELHALGVIRTSDFGATGIVMLGAAQLNTFGVHFVAGIIDELSAGHPLRRIREEDCYRLALTDGRCRPTLLLGRAERIIVGTVPPRAWYALGGAMQTTALFRAQQRAQDREREVRVREDARQEALARQREEAEPARQIDALQRRIAELERTR